MSHTKGPWRAGYGSEASRPTEMLVRAEEVDGQPWVAICRSNFGDIPIEANARLISAAPELFEALLRVVAIVGKEPEPNSEEDYEANCHEFTDAMVQANAAIARVIGNK